MSRVFVIAQGGGPTAVINQTVAGAALAARERHPGCKVLGARHGIRGVAAGDLVDLSARLRGRPPPLRRHAELGSRQHPRQAGRGVLRTDRRRAPEGECRRLHLYRRQRYRRHDGHPRPDRDRRDEVHPRAEDDRQRPRRERPHPRLHLGGVVRGRGVSLGRPRFPRHARHLCRHRHGPARRVPDRGLRRLAARGREGWPAPGLRPGGAFLAREADRRHPRRARDATAAAWWRCPRASRPRTARRSPRA